MTRAKSSDVRRHLTVFDLRWVVSVNLGGSRPNESRRPAPSPHSQPILVCSPSPPFPSVMLLYIPVEHVLGGGAGVSQRILLVPRLVPLIHFSTLAIAGGEPSKINGGTPYTIDQ